MTDKEVKKLKRSELLEILFYLQKEMEKLQQENENLRKQIESISSVNANQNPTTNSTKLSETDLAQIIAAVRETVQEAMHSQTDAAACAGNGEKADEAAGAGEDEKNC